MEPYIFTFTGVKINPLNPQPEQIKIEDIAHALALCNRFAGHTTQPLSVAQHSVYASRLCPSAGLQALLHDAAEAYLGDVTKWLKATDCMSGYREAEDRMQRVIYQRFGLPYEEHKEVTVADKLLVRYEMMRGFMCEVTVGQMNPDRERDYPPLTELEIQQVGSWRFWDWRESEDKFLRRYALVS